MKTGKYISPSGETHQVINVDEENKRVEVDYGTHCHWWNESDYLTWVSEDEEQTEDTGEMVLDYVIQEEEETTTSGIDHNPITEEEKPKKVRKRIPIKPTAKPKNKKK